MDSEVAALELGVKFQSDVSGSITGIRFYKYSTNTGTHVGNLWTAGGTRLGTVTFTSETASGWQQATFASPIAITAGTTYIASYHTSTGHYAATVNGFSSAVNSPPLHALASGSSGGNGVYAQSSSSVFPTKTWSASNYWVDVVFTSGAADTTRPTVSAVTPASGATGVATTTTVTARFSEAMKASTITPSTITLRNSSNATVAATVAYNSTTYTATLTPSAALANSATYTATITGGSSGVTDAAGNPLASNYTWSFTTAAAAADTTPPTVSAVTPTSGATGVATTTTVTARFSEAMKASTITPSTITLRNSSNATVAATVAYDSTTYTATLTPNAALANSATYTTTITGGAGGVTDAAGNPLVSNYSWSFTTTAAADTTPPTVSAVTPASGATGVGTSTTVTARFSEAMKASTISTSTIVLRNPSNAMVSATVSYNSTTFTATLTPSAALAASTMYTATVFGGSSGVTDAAGNPLANNFTWSFTTAAASGSCPCSLWTPSTTVGPEDAEVAQLELGVKFQSDVSGYITAVRFYKYAQNTGTHIGNLWSSSGTLLGRATFSAETASGWQQVTFASPIAINANTTYVASYHTTAGRYAATTSGFTNAVNSPPLHALSSSASGGNGVYAQSSSSVFPTQSYNAANYWVDVVFTTSAPADTTPPTITSTTPASGTSGVATTTTVTAKFSEAMNAATITTANMVLRDPANVTVPASVSYNASTLTATLTPSSALGNSKTYTMTVRGGTGGVTDVAGNALASDVTWSFTTAAAAPPAGNVIFYDDFTASAPDPNLWTVLDRQGDTSNSEAQCYKPANVATGSGLTLTTKVQSITCNGTSYGYTSGAVIWNSFNFTYGTVEIRALMPGGTGPWPALWFLGTNCQQSFKGTADDSGACKWPQPGSDEIDMTEILHSSHSVVNQQIHSGSNNAGCSPTTTDTSTNWHTYTMIWKAGSLEWLIDGKSTCKVTSGVPSTPMFLIINTAIGGTGGGTISAGTLPQQMKVTYVKVTQP